VDRRRIRRGGDTIRNGYPGYVAGATFAQALGWTGARVASCYGACASGAQAIDMARVQILAHMRRRARRRADTTPKGFFAPTGGERQQDPDWLRFRLLGATNPIYFGLYARRRMEIYGATERDFALVKVKNSKHGLGNPNARYRKEVTEEEVLASPGCRIRCACSRSARRATAAPRSFSRAWSSRASTRRSP
jgi:acetyl-CoA acetyltransferase